MRIPTTYAYGLVRGYGRYWAGVLGTVSSGTAHSRLYLEASPSRRTSLSANPAGTTLVRVGRPQASYKAKPQGDSETR